MPRKFEEFPTVVESAGPDEASDVATPGAAEETEEWP